MGRFGSDHKKRPDRFVPVGTFEKVFPACAVSDDEAHVPVSQQIGGYSTTFAFQ